MEIASGENRRFERVEIAWADPGELCCVIDATRMDAQGPTAATDQKIGRAGGALDLRNGADLFQQLTLKWFDPGVWKPQMTHIKERQQDSFRAKSGIEGHQVTKAFHE